MNNNNNNNTVTFGFSGAVRVQLPVTIAGLGIYIILHFPTFDGAVKEPFALAIVLALSMKVNSIVIVVVEYTLKSYTLKNFIVP